MENSSINIFKALFPDIDDMNYVVVESDFVKRSSINLGRDNVYYININNRLSEKEKRVELLGRLLDIVLPQSTENFKSKVNIVKSNLFNFLRLTEKIGESIMSKVDKGEVSSGNRYKLYKICIYKEGISVVVKAQSSLEELKEGEYNWDVV